MYQKTPIIAIVGRPNVGKSTLFNRLIGKRLAITSEIAGTTRDRIYYNTEFNGISVILVDTGGMEYGKKENIEADIQSQVKLAIVDADLIYFVIDAKETLTINDLEAANSLRKSKKTVLFIANKVDGQYPQEDINEIIKLGFGQPQEISAYHNAGIEELIEVTEKTLKKLGFKKTEKEPENRDIINICFIGRPNVGKSSLVNALLGKPKVIVSDIPGTTRDSTDTAIIWNGQKFNLIDTAGIRRRGKIGSGLEKISILRSLQSIEKADVVCLVLDYEEGISKQDQHITSYILEASKGLILVVNKSDLMKDREEDQTKMINILRRKFEFLPWAPAIFISALRNKNTEKVLELSKQIQIERYKIIPDEELDGFMKETVHKNTPPRVSQTRPDFYSLKQIKTNPPTFVFIVNVGNALHFSYRRYLENELRKRYPFTGTSIKFIYKKRELLL